MITDEAAEDPVSAHLNAHYRPNVAADLLAAAQPLMALAWDEGASAALDALNKQIRREPYKMTNPYRKAIK